MPEETMHFTEAGHPVRIKITARQSMVAPLFGYDGDTPPSLFGAQGSREAWDAYRYVENKSYPSDEDEGITPEKYPEALEYAIDDMIDRDTDGYGFPPEDDPEDPDDPDDPEDPEETGDGDSDAPVSKEELDVLLEKLSAILAEAKGEEYDDDDYIARTSGFMEKRILPDGSLEISVSYEEVEPMEGARTVISFNSHRPDVVSISRFGPISSMIVCEPGVRHVTAYQTPYAVFELAVVGRRCSTEGMTYLHGGLLELEYFVELLGADLQYTRMKIEVEPME